MSNSKLGMSHQSFAVFSFYVQNVESDNVMGKVSKFYQWPNGSTPSSYT